MHVITLMCYQQYMHRSDVYYRPYASLTKASPFFYFVRKSDVGAGFGQTGSMLDPKQLIHLTFAGRSSLYAKTHLRTH